MPHSFKLPDLGEGLTEGEVARWLVAEGQEVAEDDPLVEIQTDKATVEIPSPYAGTVLRILVAEGEVAPVGAVLVVIGAPGEAVPETPSPSEPAAQRERAVGSDRPLGASRSDAARAQGRPGARSRSRDRDRHGPRRQDHRRRRAGCRHGRCSRLGGPP